jgi:hypothetical protein
METKKLINRETMTNATLKRILQHNGVRNIYELVTLAKSEGARLGRSDIDKQVKATQYYIDKYNDEIMEARDAKKQKQINKKLLYKQLEKERKENLKKAGKELKELIEKNKKIVKRQKENAKLYIKQNDKNFNNFFQGKINKFDVDLSKMTYTDDKNTIEEIFEKHILNKVPNQQDVKNFMVLEIENKFYSLSNKFINELIVLMVEQIEGFGSDSQLIMKIKNIKKFTIHRFEPKNKNNKKEGAFFPFVNSTNIDLSLLQIFNSVNKNNYQYNCLIYALMMSNQVSVEKLNQVKLMCCNEHVPFTSLEKIADIIEHTITVRDDEANKNLRKFGKYENIIELGLMKNHYFLIYKTDYTAYSVENYEKIKHLPNFNQIFQEYAPNKYSRTSDRGLDSFKLVKKMMELNMFIPMTMEQIMTTQFTNEIKNLYDTLNYNEKTCIREIKNSSSKIINRPIIVFDFETNPIDLHVPYLCCCYDGKTLKTFYGIDCGKQLLEYVPNDCQLIAHNAGYDYRFLIQYLTNLNEISRGNHLLSASANFFNKRVHIKDSYNLITMPLRDFGKTFKLDIKKEVMPYKLYTSENINKVYVPIDEALQLIKSDEQDQFLDNINKWNLKQDETFNIIEYSARYCELDCIVLYQGYTIFSEWIKTQLNIDLSQVLTSASLAHKYFVNSGCYDKVVEIGGVPQSFIQETVVGGRCMVANNIKNHRSNDGHIDNDFDAVSLYPSAMSRMGFLKGIPKVIETFEPNKYDGYFIEIEILHVGIKRDFPLASYIRDDGVRDFTNDMVGKRMKVDKTTLEDLIEFQKIEYKFIKGYYFNDGFNYQIQDTIKYLFNQRLKLKKEKNPAELIYKLIMNSGYGKSIMKPIEYENVFFNNEEEFEKYWCRHHNYVKEGIKFGQAYKIKKIKPLNEHFNIAHVGTTILSMSKRIMNEVMCSAEDNGCKMFYQDTDSIHISDKDISKLEKIFKEKYNRDLIGKNLGQFHSDFDIKGCKNIVAVESVFLGKKSYIDVIQGEDEETGEIKQDYHIRLKGIPNQVILNHCKNNNITPLQLYKDMYNSKKISFDLTDGSTCFEFKPDYSIVTKKLFTREICF